MDFYATRRGLLRADFPDRYGKECSIQESSLPGENCIWLGVDVDQEGADVQNGRMHLTQEMARKLLPVLRYFAREGHLGVDSPNEKFAIGSWVVGVGPYNTGVEGRIVSLRRGDSMIVQDFRRPGLEGQVVSTWDQADLIWEPTETPAEIPSWFDHLRQDDDD